jgi:hypothetical protein
VQSIKEWLYGKNYTNRESRWNDSYR